MPAQCEGQIGACSVSQRFWVFVLGEQALWGQNDKAQHPLGCLQSEVQVYCLLPGGGGPGVIDLFRSHHWEEILGIRIISRALSHHRPNPSPSCSSPPSWVRGSGRGATAALGHSGEAPGDPIRPIPILLRAGREDTAAFSSKPSASFHWF